jgi:hypothetical protein
VAVVAVIAPFLVSGPAVLSELGRMGRIAPSIARSGWWNVIVIPHEVWSLICLAIVLLYFTSRELGEKSLPVHPVPFLPSVRQGFVP